MDTKEKYRLYNLVGQNIKKQRELHNISLEKLASLTNCTKESLQQIENSNNNVTFSLATMYLLANTLDIDIKVLFDGLEENTK